MKRILVLIAISLLTACGSGGGGGGNTVTEVSGQTSTGVLNVTFNDGAATAKSVAMQTHEYVRVVISNSSLVFNGAPFKVVQDQPPGGKFEFALPLAKGYTVEAITYNIDDANGLNVVLDYAVAKNVSITSSTSNSVALTLYAADARLSVPGTVIHGTKFPVLANLSTAAGRTITPLQSAWYMPPPQTTPVFENRTSAFRYLTSHSVTAPLAATKLYFQGIFSLKPSLLAAGETSKQWIFNTPRAGFGNLSTSVLAPINVTFDAP